MASSRFMKRLAASLVLLAAVACSKPSPEDCRKAVLNMQRIRELDKDTQNSDPEVWVRKCRATGSPDTVRCLIAAKTEDELTRCEKR